ncbi:hypothetical protein AAFF_G00303800 [Aldrovandia affinis]|uniref:Uncharacterized protein n=1 Tax=Aldrovandia affinis TaxID=143900 RepID=A0AAD7SNW6_9TELE|nr:hypothetical protein AAFF_G00303800 [Aldrovandia affinis]
MLSSGRRTSTTIRCDVPVDSRRWKYPINGQVAFALNIPHDECIHDLDHNFLKNDIPGGTDHAEYRLLVLPDRGEENTPMHHLLNRRRAQNDCLVFFSTYTPCMSMCTNAFHGKRILDHLQIFHNWGREFKAFVFYDIYDTDKDKTKETVLNSLRAIHNKGDIPVFRCNSYNGQNHCFNCMNNEVAHCFWGWDQRIG